MDMRRIVAVLVEEAEQQIYDQVWRLAPSDRALALEAEAGLRDAVGPPDVQQALPQLKRLEHLRETLAVLAISLSRTHGRLAWFLSGALNALEPVLRWRALPADRGGTFGTVLPSPGEYTEAEDAVRRLQDALAHLTANPVDLGSVRPDPQANED
ncbi:hypothetical protein M2164_000219 [Streptomyces sp. SAI-208]|uniref:hypothetical protein n=1 Tax=Streptomyces sp. SAI-208 TaxID=2940550 RepID=UPI0024730C0D|nr:hypothetical protein [Streptomyces sp. SAI-208]MDH6604584.1 hypothetical protein [Streptomyces sp. SAI-208]